MGIIIPVAGITACAMWLVLMCMATERYMDGKTDDAQFMAIMATSLAVIILVLLQ